MTFVERIFGRKGWMSVVAGSATAMACVLGASNAAAQVSFEASTQQQGAPAPAANAGETDHDKFVGHLGIGWFGVSDIPMGAGGETVSAPAIGVRYWLDRGLGIDVGLGFSMASGSSTTKTGGQENSTDHPSATAFLIHGGLPLALYTEKHYSLLVIPELNFGFTSGREKSASGGSDTDHSGMRFDLGARAGAEVHFGFMGIPALALEGSVGLFFTTQSGKTETGPDWRKESTTGITTSSFNSPWDFFRSSVAARYYF